MRVEMVFPQKMANMRVEQHERDGSQGADKQRPYYGRGLVTIQPFSRKHEQESRIICFILRDTF